MKRSLLILVFAGSLGLAQLPENQYSSGLLNGRFWKSLNDSNRVTFLIGWEAHIEVSKLEGLKTTKSLFPKTSTFGEVALGLSNIYEAPENAAVPIVFAIDAFAMRVQGAPEAEIQERLRLARQNYAVPEAAEKK